MLGQHEGMEDFVRVQTRRLCVEAAGEVPYQLDGDPGGELPAEFSVLPGRLTMLVGKSWAREHGVATQQ
jgi:diacylglycerol kinase family enzyme